MGKRIGITATKALREKFENEFMKYGARVYTLCDMQPDRTKEYGSFSEKLHSLKDYSWVVFTSRNAINLFFDEMVNENIDYRSLCDIRFAVIGSGTKEDFWKRASARIICLMNIQAGLWQKDLQPMWLMVKSF